MSDVCQNNSYPASKKSSSHKNIFNKDVTNEDDSNNFSDEREEVTDERRYEFAMIDYKFIEAGFDPFTVSLYLRIVMRADNHDRGCFERKNAIAKGAQISSTTQTRCRALLEYCNIIKITQRVDPNNPNVMIPSKITLIDKSKWNLNHEHRNASKFYVSEDNIRGGKFRKNRGLVPVEPGGRFSQNRGSVPTEPHNKNNPNKTKFNKTNKMCGKNESHTEKSGIKIPMPLKIQVADFAQITRNSKRFCNDEAERIILGVIKEIPITVYKFKADFQELIEFPNVLEVARKTQMRTNDFINLIASWCLNKEAIKEENKND